MANINPAFAVLAGLGFENAGTVSFGTWKGYAAAASQMGLKGLAVDFAVRLPSKTSSAGKEIRRILKDQGWKKISLQRLTKNALVFIFNFGKATDLSAYLRDALDAITAAMRQAGVAPADTCAITGAARPDSLCLMQVEGVLSYQPVCAAAMRDKNEQTRAQTEDNQLNGSYPLGIVGALLGMIVGVIPNVFVIIVSGTIYSLLFALVPLAAMFGYKLFKGKMSKASVVIVILVSLLAVLLIPTLQNTYAIMKYYGETAVEAFHSAVAWMLLPGSLADMSAELLQLLLFMGLGIWIAWRFISGQTNSSQMMDSAARQATLRPNPNYAQSSEPEVYAEE